MRGRGLSRVRSEKLQRVGQRYRRRSFVFVSGQLLKLGWLKAQKVGDRGPILPDYTSKEWLPVLERDTLGL